MTKFFNKSILTIRSQQTNLFYQYIFLLIGFFGGNLWGSFFSSFCLPPVFFVIGILLCLEVLSYIYYKNLSYQTLKQFAVNLKFKSALYKNKKSWEKNLFNPLQNPHINKPLYLLKIGLIFGIFVDAFKVGS